jgi:hypothetical protein
VLGSSSEAAHPGNAQFHIEPISSSVQASGATIIPSPTTVQLTFPRGPTNLRLRHTAAIATTILRSSRHFALLGTRFARCYCLHVPHEFENRNKAPLLSATSQVKINRRARQPSIRRHLHLLPTNLEPFSVPIVKMNPHQLNKIDISVRPQWFLLHRYTGERKKNTNTNRAHTETLPG